MQSESSNRNSRQYAKSVLPRLLPESLRYFSAGICCLGLGGTVVAQAPVVPPTIEAGFVCTIDDFEGVGDSYPYFGIYSWVPQHDEVRFPDWHGYVAIRAGGLGNFYNEPSPYTAITPAAELYPFGPQTWKILFGEPASRVSLFYAANAPVRLIAYDSDGHPLDEAVGDANWWYGMNDPVGSGTEWDLLEVRSSEQDIVEVHFVDHDGALLVDDLKICRRLFIESIELTQVIQKYRPLEALKNDLAVSRETYVPLLEGRNTVARVYLRPIPVAAKGTIQFDIADTANSMTLSRHIPPACDAQRQRRGQDGCRSINFGFVAPEGEWEATVRLLGEDGTELEAHALPLKSRDADELVLRAVSVCDRKDEHGEWLCGDAAKVGRLTRLLERIAPASGVRVEVLGDFIRNDIEIYDNYGKGGNDNDIIDDVEAKRWISETLIMIDDLHGIWDWFADLDGAERHYWGVMRDEVESGALGKGRIEGRGGIGKAHPTVLGGLEFGQETLAHEIGHMLGLQHTNVAEPVALGGVPPGCWALAPDSNALWPFATNHIQSRDESTGVGVLEVGFDVFSRRTLLPESTFEVMGYCAPVWISPFSFKQGLRRFNRSSDGVVPSQALSQPRRESESGLFWAIRGVLSPEGLKLNPIFEVEIPGPIGDGVGNYRIEARSAEGVVVAARSFSPQQTVLEDLNEEGNSASATAFLQFLEVDRRAELIVVVEDEGEDLISVDLGRGVAPQVAITSPLQSDLIIGATEVRWSVVDPDSSQHWSTVDYSLDEGATWSRLGLVESETSLLANFDLVAGSEKLTLRVTVSDGVNNGVDTVEGFSVDTKEPTVEINIPIESQAVARGESVILSATPFDLEDGFIRGNAVKWFSSIDGFLGNGETLTLSSLSPGSHSISVEVRDQDNNIATDVTNLRVIDGPPFIEMFVARRDELPTTCVDVTIDVRPRPSLVEYSLDGGDNWVVISGTLPWQFTVPGDGFVHLLGRAIDDAGQVAITDRRFLIEDECADPIPAGTVPSSSACPEATFEEWSFLGPFGGAVQALAVDPTVSGTLYAGTNHGVFKSTDSGATWIDSNGLLDPFVSSLAIDPLSSSTIYAGHSGGVLKSTDAGASWSPTNTGLPAFPFVKVLRVDPSTPSILYAATEAKGIFKSVDAGGSWRQINDGLADLWILALAINPLESSTLYAGTRSNGLFRSTDAGSQWEPVGGPGNQVTALVIDSATPTTVYAAVYAGAMGNSGGVFRSSDSGATWAPMTTGPANTVISVLALDRSTPTTLYLGSRESGIYKSVDGGDNWVPTNVGVSNPIVLALAIDPSRPNTLYAGTAGGAVRSFDSGDNWEAVDNGMTSTHVRSLTTDPLMRSTLYAGTRGGGVFKSTDTGRTWAPSGPRLDPRMADVRVLVVDPSAPSILYAVTQIAGGVYRSTDSGSTWDLRSGGIPSNAFVSTLAMDPSDHLVLFAGTTSGEIYKTTNGGNTWQRSSNGLGSSRILVLTADPSAPDTLYAGTAGSGVFKSTNGGNTWVRGGDGSLVGLWLTALAIDSSAQQTVLYAGTADGGVFRSTDSGASWSSINIGLPSTDVRALAIDPSAPRTLYAGVGEDGIFKSVDTGDTWVAFNDGLTYTGVQAFAIEPGESPYILAATGRGIFQSQRVESCLFNDDFESADITAWSSTNR